MRTIPYKQILRGVFALKGVDWAEATREQTRMVMEFIHERTLEMWEAFNWPEVCAVEQRAFADGLFAKRWEAVPGLEGVAPGAIAWPAEKVLYFDFGVQGYYRVRAPGPLIWPGSATGPEALPALLEKVEDVTPFVSWRQRLPLDRATREMGTILSVTQEDPRRVCERAGLPFKILEGEGVDLCGPCVPDSVWIHFRKRPEAWLGDVWDGAWGGWSAGERVYHPPTGDFWERLGGAEVEPGTDAAAWVRRPYPARFESYVKRSAFADWLRVDGAFAEATVQRRTAEQRISEEVRLLAGVQHQVGRARALVRR